MPLPAYMLQQPTIDPIDVLARRIRAKGVEIEMFRQGKTIQMRNMDTQDLEAATAAIRIVGEYADLNFMVVDALVPSILGHLDSAYLSNGFLVGYEGGEENERGEYQLMRRKPRR